MRERELGELIVYLVESAGIGAARGEAGGRAQSVRRRDEELHERSRGQPRDQSGEAPRRSRRGRRRHQGRRPRAAVGRPPQGHGGDAIGIVGLDRDQDWRVRRGNHRAVLKIPKRRPEVRLPARVARARRAGQVRARQAGRARATIVVKPRVQLVIPGDPPGAKRDLILTSVHHAGAVGERGFHEVAHVIGHAGGGEMKDVIGRVVRIDDDLGVVMAEHTPARQAVLEAAVGHQFGGGTCG